MRHKCARNAIAFCLPYPAIHSAVAVCTKSINRGSPMSHPIRSSVLAVVAAGCGSLTRTLRLRNLRLRHRKSGRSKSPAPTSSVSIPRRCRRAGELRAKIERTGKSSIAEVIRQYFVNSGNSLNKFSPTVSRRVRRAFHCAAWDKEHAGAHQWPTHGQLRFCAKPARHVR